MLLHVVVGCAAAIFLAPLVICALGVAAPRAADWALQERVWDIITATFAWCWLALFAWWYRASWRSGNFIGGAIILLYIAVVSTQGPYQIAVGFPPGAVESPAVIVLGVLLPLGYILWVVAGRRK